MGTTKVMLAKVRPLKAVALVSMVAGSSLLRITVFRLVAPVNTFESM